MKYLVLLLFLVGCATNQNSDKVKYNYRDKYWFGCMSTYIHFKYKEDNFGEVVKEANNYCTETFKELE